MEEMYPWIRPKDADVTRQRLFDAWGAGDLLCLGFALEQREALADSLFILVGFSLKTGTWELLYDDLRRLMVQAKPLELRLDSFLG